MQDNGPILWKSCLSGYCCFLSFCMKYYAVIYANAAQQKKTHPNRSPAVAIGQVVKQVAQAPLLQGARDLSVIFYLQMH